MTYEQYWEQDSELVKYYRKAFELRQEEQNRAAWLQGMYIYEAIADLAPILHAFAKRGTKARPYPQKPYEFQKPVRKDSTRGLSPADKAAKEKANRIKVRMMAAMRVSNAEKAKKRAAEEQKRKTEAGKALMEDEPGKGPV